MGQGGKVAGHVRGGGEGVLVYGNMYSQERDELEHSSDRQGRDEIEHSSSLRVFFDGEASHISEFCTQREAWFGVRPGLG